MVCSNVVLVVFVAIVGFSCLHFFCRLIVLLCGRVLCLVAVGLEFLSFAILL